MPGRVEVVSVIDAVTADLRARVLAGELEPGTPLAEVDIAERYEVARPTAKAAIENLVRSRLLDRRAHKTARVVRLTPEDVRDIYRARALLESQVVRELAAANAVVPRAHEANVKIHELHDASPLEIVEPDMRFHTSLVDAVGSDRASRMYNDLASEVVLCMSQIQGAALLPDGVIASEHDELMRLIKAGEGDAAAELLHVHIARAREKLAERLGGVPGPEAFAPGLG